MEKWEEFWGSKAEYDIAPDLEERYEDVFNKSCVYWTDDTYEHRYASTELKDRGEIFYTEGYTDEFEDWGIKKTTEAIENGCKTALEIEHYIRNNAEYD